MAKVTKQFSVVIGNPPYQAPKKMDTEKKKGTIGGDLWSKFVKLSLNLMQENGYLCLVHPPAWRKPEHDLLPLLASKNIRYLEIHGERDGQRVFGATTAFDWYVLQNAPSTGKTVVKNDEGSRTVDLASMPFLPSGQFDAINGIIAKEGDEKCQVLFSRSEYGSDKTWMHETQTAKFKYPCVHSMRESGELVCWYSDCRKGFFGVPKVILNFGRHLYPYNDYKGEYGTTQIAFGIIIGSKEEGDNICRAIKSDRFIEIVKATKWSSFQTDWRMFKYFRKNFWKEFV